MGYKERSYLDKDLWDLDPGACQLLEQICNDEQALLVISSTWRKRVPHDELSRLFHQRRIRAPIVGYTPVIWPPAGIVRSKTGRGLEIQWWRRTYRAEQLKTGVRMCILDDDSDMGDLLPWLVSTSMSSGLLPEHADLVPQKLREPLVRDEWEYDALKFDARFPA